MENEANLLLPLGMQKLKGFQRQGDFTPWTPLGAPPQTPLMGRYRLWLAVRTRHVRSLHIF